MGIWKYASYKSRLNTQFLFFHRCPNCLWGFHFEPWNLDIMYLGSSNPCLEQKPREFRSLTTSMASLSIWEWNCFRSNNFLPELVEPNWTKNFQTRWFLSKDDPVSLFGHRDYPKFHSQCLPLILKHLESTSDLETVQTMGRSGNGSLERWN